MEVDQPTARRKRPWVVRAAFAVAVSVGALALLVVAAAFVAEALVRLEDGRRGRTLADYRPKGEAQLTAGLYVPHPFLGYALRPGYDRRGDPSIRGASQIHINALGMRGAELPASKAEGVVRVLCLGGSTTFCTSAMSDAATWPAVLERLLNEHAPAGRRFEVGNAGVPGWCSIESLINFSLRLVELDPDVILVYDVPNDSRAIQMRGVQPDYAHLRRAWMLDRVGPVDAWLAERSHLYGRVSAALAPPEQGHGSLQRYAFTEGFKERHVRSDTRVVDEGIRYFVRNVRHLMDLAQGHGVLPVLQTFADCPQVEAPDGERYTEAIARQNEELVRLAAQLDLPLADMRDLRDRPELFDDWMHYNDGGCEAHARRLAAILLATPQFRARLE